MCFSWSGGTRCITGLAVLLGLGNTRAVTKTRTPRNEGNWRRRSRRLGAAGCLSRQQPSAQRWDLVGYTVLERPDCQYAAKAVRSATREPTKLDWTRMMRLAKLLVAHSELERCTETQTGRARRREGAQPEHSNSLDCIPIEFSCSTQHVVALSSGEAELCATRRTVAGGLQSVQCWPRLEWI